MLAEGPPASVVGGLWPSRQGLCWGGTPLAAPLPLGDWNYGYPKMGSLGQHGRRGPWRNRGLSWRCSFVLKIVPGPGCLPPPAPNSPPHRRVFNLFTAQAPAVSPWECYISFARPWLGSQASAAGISPGDSFLWTSRPMLVPSPRHCLPGAGREQIFRCY